jgi:hypothetical protein
MPADAEGHVVTLANQDRGRCSPAARDAQQERERVPLLAGQRRRGIDQPGNVGIQARIAVVFGLPVAVGSSALPTARGRG